MFKALIRESTASATIAGSGRFEGIGEYQFSGPSAREHGRRLFFAAMAKVNPQFLQSLVDGAYRVALECGIDLSGDSPSSAKEILAARRRVRKAVRQWCARWRLVDSWCEDLASDTVFGWVRDPESQGRWAAEDRQWIADASFPRFRDFDLKFPGWSFVLQTWADFETAVSASYRSHLEQYRKEAARAAIENHGLVRTRSKRKPVHYLWLARYLLLGDTTSDIARFGVDTPSAEAVRKAIVRLACDIGLTLPKKPEKP